jgi:hypothetical protein
MKWEDFFFRKAAPLKWFKGLKYLTEGKKLYKELMLKHHPDRGGDAEVCKEINDEFDSFLVQAVKEEPNSDKADFDFYEMGSDFTYKKRRFTDRYWETLGAAMRLNCDVEVMGTWIWLWNVSPIDVFQVINLGFTNSRKHGGWFWYDPEVQDWNSHIGPKREYTTGDLRDLWGSSTKKKKQFLGG